MVDREKMAKIFALILTESSYLNERQPIQSNSTMRFHQHLDIFFDLDINCRHHFVALCLFCDGRFVSH